MIADDPPGVPNPGSIELASPLDSLPRVDRRSASLIGRLARMPNPMAGFLAGPFGGDARVGAPEVRARASGLNRPGVVAQLAWPRRATRIGLGVEATIAHAWVDRLLGFRRLPAEAHRQVTPVEVGILRHRIETALSGLAARAGPMGPWDLLVDRVGVDPFDAADLGGVTTVRWPIEIVGTSGSARLWLPDQFVDAWIAAPASAPATVDPSRLVSYPYLAGVWHAEVGTVPPPRAPARLRVGLVLPIVGSPLRGSAASPSGPATLAIRVDGARLAYSAEFDPAIGGGKIRLTSPMIRLDEPREPLIVDDPTAPHAAPSPPAAPDLPVTIAVELGRVNLPLARVADLKPGDLIPLNRHGREPVELTSGGRLIARGELVQIDTEIGVRITNLFL